jgi:class 3 adenylate cyclase/tetratricopeptide (TPR) repeat protein
VKSCPSCGRENADDARFCAQCATPLTAEAPAREERKVVTCLFCDLVGFTARAEAMDPEDVRRLLQPYHASVRAELERFGGTVEKFIGDAVMAVFGAPVAHEDDPERAVRAALSIRDQLVEEGELEVRIGITTGEALVVLGARPEAGEGMASGDVVNTAARLQAAAPTNGILVDETTYHSTESVIDYEASEAVEAKGKSLRVPAWSARAARLPVGAEQLGAASLVGREHELGVLGDAVERALNAREPRLVTLLGVPGIGKSRLVRELRALVDDGSFGNVSWLHGRSLAYGADVSYRALGEIVKGQTGILETDSTEIADAKLSAALGTLGLDGSAEDWLHRHLAPLLGIAESRDVDDRRAERFAAWRRFLEELARTGPLVLVFEDLHWADDGMLDFVASLGAWPTDLPVLVLATARTDLLERRPGWGAWERATVLPLEPLSDEATAKLIDQLLVISGLTTDARSTLREQAAGNPLFAEQYVRMTAERGAEHAVPDTVQALIVARLDALPEPEKRVAQDASITGAIFWSGSVAAAGGDDRWTVEELLQALERKALVRRASLTSVADETEWAFGHALIHEAAYSAIPRSVRADKHQRVAGWIEALGRHEDHAELLAHHYTSALDLASAAGIDIPDLPARALAALRRAGERAASLYSFASAARFYRRALELVPTADPERGRLLLELGRSAWIAEGAAEQELRTASEALMAAGDREGVAEAEALLVEVYWVTGRREDAAKHVERASALADVLEPSPAKAELVCFLARTRNRASDYVTSLRLAREASALAESLGLEELGVSALALTGGAELELGQDEAGFAHLEASLEKARSIGAPLQAIRAASSLAHHLRHHGEFTRSVPYFEEALRLSERYGNTPQRRLMLGMLPQQRYRQGRWDEALDAADAYLDETPGGYYQTWQALQTRGLIRLSRGDEGGIADSESSIEAARASVDPAVLSSALAVYGRALVFVSRMDDARVALDESLELFEATEGRSGFDLPYVTITAFEVGEDERRVLTPRRDRTWAEAARCYLAGEFGRAADVYQEIGTVTDEAEARLRSGLALLGAGKQSEGAADVARALSFFRSVGATHFVRQGEAALADAGLEIPA